MDFSNPVESKPLILEFSVIQDFVIGDLDDDSTDDLLIASFSGHVWVVRSNPPDPLLLELNGPIENLNQTLTTGNSIFDISIGIVSSIISTSLIGAMTYRKKKAKKIHK